LSGYIPSEQQVNSEMFHARTVALFSPSEAASLRSPQSQIEKGIDVLSQNQDRHSGGADNMWRYAANHRGADKKESDDHSPQSAASKSQPPAACAGRAIHRS
jgi:hypothetical protein